MTTTAQTTTAQTTPAQTDTVSYTDDGSSLTFTVGDQDIATYTYRPTDDQYESPRPFFHPLTTLEGDEVTISRPWDHVWHKGLSWALPNVGEHNFWGGATYTRETGYANLDNNGAMNHEAFTSIEVTGIEGAGAGITATESLLWTAQPAESRPSQQGQAGAPLIREQRRFAIQLLPTGNAWALLFETTMDNVSGAEIGIGSPTTEGRDNAGYGGLFWRGPRSFTGGGVPLRSRDRWRRIHGHPLTMDRLHWPARCHLPEVQHPVRRGPSQPGCVQPVVRPLVHVRLPRLGTVLQPSCPAQGGPTADVPLRRRDC